MLTFVSLAGALATPIGLGAVYSLSANEGDLFMRAEEYAREQFNANASLIVRDLWATPTRLGTFGENVRADPGYHFVHAKILLENTGKVDIAPSFYQFSAIDDAGSEVNAELDSPHHDFDASRLRKGGLRQGEVVFEMRNDALVAAIFWQGELANATGPAPPLRLG